MTNPILIQALACAERGWPVFPCQADSKIPATLHGYLDATTDPARIRAWYTGDDRLNLAVATGAPGPDVLDIDHHGPAGDGYAALGRLRDAGLLDGIAASVQTPSNGLHLYLTGSAQRCGHLPRHLVDFLAKGGYVLLPPSQVDGKPYTQLGKLGADHGLDWAAATQVLQPPRSLRRPASAHSRTPRMSALAEWVAAQRPGNRNAGLYWAANRALETSQGADLSPLAAAARQAGLSEPEITRTLDSARHTSQATPEPPEPEAEGTG